MNVIDIIKSVATKFGVLGGIQHVKQGRGVITKFVTLCVVGVLVIGAMAWRTETDSDLVFRLALIVLAIILIGVVAAVVMGFKNPHDGVSEKYALEIIREQQLNARNPAIIDQQAQQVIRAPAPDLAQIDQKTEEGE